MRFRKELRNIRPYQAGKPIEEVKRELGLSKVYKLASNEIPFAPTYLKAVFNSEAENINRYPEGSCFYLRQVISKRLAVAPEQLVFGNGSDEIIVLALRALIRPADEVIVSYPTFLIYELQAKIHEAKLIRVPLRNLRYDLEAIASKVSGKTKLIFIANPDNPTGTYLNQAEIERFLARIPKEVVVFFDEAYFEFAPKDFPDSLRLLRRRGNIIITRTFSKAYGLAGLRIGYGITSKECASILNTIREPFNVNRMAQAAACEALRNKSFLRKVIAYVYREKQYLYKALSDCGLSYIASATNFILVDFKRDTRNLFDYLMRRGVIVRPLACWGLPRFFRVTVGLHRENVAFIRHLRSYLREKKWEDRA